MLRDMIYYASVRLIVNCVAAVRGWLGGRVDGGMTGWLGG